MKNILIGCALTALALFGTSIHAEARSHEKSRVYVSGYTRHGTPIYVERYVAGYDRHGRPIWAKRVIRPAYRPVYRPHYVAPCPPTVRYHSRPEYRGTRVTIGASF